MWLKVYKSILLRTIFVLTALCIVIWAVFSFASFLRKKTYPIEYKEEVLFACEKFEVAPEVVFSLIKVESNFNPYAVSGKGAIGLMQIMPATAEFIAQKLSVTSYDLFNPQTNILFGVWYIKYLILRFEDLSVAVCAYNAGEGTVRIWLKKTEFSTDGKRLNIIPYPETEQYLKNFEKSLKNYVKLCVHILDK